MTTIAIVDYGMGNFHSVARALKYAAPDADIRICNQPHEIDAADRVVFPGQGAMPDCMRCWQTLPRMAASHAHEPCACGSTHSQETPCPSSS